MNSIGFFYFTLIQLYANRSKHIGVVIIASILIAILSSFIFLADSIGKQIKSSIEKQSDYIVQRVLSGKSVDTPLDWADNIITIDGVSKVTPRVYGRYYYEPLEHYFTIVGIDLFDEQTKQEFQTIIDSINIKEFLSKDHMIVGEGVKNFLNEYGFKEYYNFRPPDKSIKKVYIYDQFDDRTNLVSSDMIIMDMKLAKKILGIKKDYCSDILLDISNIDERENIKNKIRATSLFDIRLISKDDLLKVYSGFFDYKSSLFLTLYILVLVSFALILYQRYTYINSIDKKEIGILRTLGWNISKIIKLKVLENIILFSFAFFVGINLAYFYVFVLNAPVLSGVFLGISNLSYDVSFIPIIDFSTLLMIFLYFMVPIIAVIIFPVWRISITDPSEALK